MTAEDILEGPVRRLWLAHKTMPCYIGKPHDWRALDEHFEAPQGPREG